jgi:hypothetical protein
MEYFINLVIAGQADGTQQYTSQIHPESVGLGLPKTRKFESEEKFIQTLNGTFIGPDVKSIMRDLRSGGNVKRGPIELSGNQAASFGW